AMAILLEMMRVGNFQKVVAVDEASGTEVTFMAPVTASRLDIERLARSKLAYVMRRKTPDS
ncbi:MAG: DUF6898 family protein, partial [Alphaproteobacteria bacterium]